MRGPINSVASLLNQSIDASIAYLKENAVAILLLVLLWRFLLSSYRSRPTNGYSMNSSPSQNTETRQEELRRVRQRQQEIADERAKQAAVLRKEKELKEKERKNQVALSSQEGRRLRDGQQTNTSSRLRSTNYNPMQPWNTGTSSYRPTRRTPPGGGS